MPWFMGATSRMTKRNRMRVWVRVRVRSRVRVRVSWRAKERAGEGHGNMAPLTVQVETGVPTRCPNFQELDHGSMDEITILPSCRHF